MALGTHFKKNQKKQGTAASRIAERERKRKADEEAAQKPAKDAAAKRKKAAEEAEKNRKKKSKNSEWGENEDGTPRKQPTASEQIKKHKESVERTKEKNKTKAKVKEKTPAETEAEARKAWEKKTRNSPARKSGAFTDDQLWAQQKKHRKWKSTNKSSKEARMERRNKRLKKKGLPIPKKKENKKKLEITK